MEGKSVEMHQTDFIDQIKEFIRQTIFQLQDEEEIVTIYKYKKSKTGEFTVENASGPKKGG